MWAFEVRPTEFHLKFAIFSPHPGLWVPTIKRRVAVSAFVCVKHLAGAVGEASQLRGRGCAGGGPEPSWEAPC